MVIAAAVLLVLLALVAGFLSLPVDVEVSRPGGGLPAEVRVGWLAGRLSWERTAREEPSAGEPAPDRAAGEPALGEEEEEDRAPGRWGPGARQALAALRTPGLAGPAVRLLSRLAAAVRLRRAAARVRLADPADTGRLWGVVGPGVAILPPAWRTRIHLRPDFAPGGAGVTGRLQARVVPIRLVAAALAFLLSPAVLRAGWRAVRAG